MCVEWLRAHVCIYSKTGLVLLDTFLCFSHWIYHCSFFFRLWSSQITTTAGNQVQNGIQNASKERRATENKYSAHPVLDGEWILEVKDWEEETDKLPESHNQRDNERGTFRREDEDASDAHVLCDTVAQDVQPQFGNSNSSKWNRLCNNTII